MTRPLDIVVVDDDPDMRTVLNRCLSEDGHRVACFPGVEKSVPHFACSKVDLVLLDLRMPGIPGGVLLAHLRRNGVKVPVIVISGNAKPDELQQFRALDAVFLPKPFDTHALRKMIEKVLAEAKPPPMDPHAPTDPPARV